MKVVKITPKSNPEVEFVRYGGRYSLPVRFTAVLEPDAGESYPRCELTVAIENGRAVCEGFSCMRVDGSAPITGTVLRTLSLGTWVREATVAAGRQYAGRHLDHEGPLWAQDEDGTRALVVTEPVLGGGSHLRWVGAEREPGFQAATRAPQRAPRRGIPLTDADLEDVARIYRGGCARRCADRRRC